MLGLIVGVGDGVGVEVGVALGVGVGVGVVLGRGVGDGVAVGVGEGVGVGVGVGVTVCASANPLTAKSRLATRRITVTIALRCEDNLDILSFLTFEPKIQTKQKMILSHALTT